MAKVTVMVYIGYIFVDALGVAVVVVVFVYHLLNWVGKDHFFVSWHNYILHTITYLNKVIL